MTDKGWFEFPFSSQELLRRYVVAELGHIIAEIRVPMNTGIIATSLAQHLQQVVAAWPDVQFMGKSMAAWQPEQLEEMMNAHTALWRAVTPHE